MGKIITLFLLFVY